MRHRWLVIWLAIPLAAAVRMRPVPPLESMLRAGRLYLSLMDFIVLAIENNLDGVLRPGDPIRNRAAVEAERKNYAAGAPTSYRPISMARYLYAARRSELFARAAYDEPHAEPGQVTGLTLNRNESSHEEARVGVRR